jgi:hypothetical protein
MVDLHAVVVVNCDQIRAEEIASKSIKNK